MKNFKQEQSGAMLVTALVATGLFLTVTMGTIGLALLQQKLYIRKVARAQALHVAEAGVNYYRWVLYHNDDDYCNEGAGETCVADPENDPYGPYPYSDSAGNGITGYYELYIIPPPVNGSTIVTIRSIGWVDEYPNIKREIEVRCGIQAWSSFSTLADAEMRFGVGTEVWGPIHSNGGVRFDGLAHNIITSEDLDYDDPDHSGGNEFGVHTHIFPTDPLPDGNNPPENVPNRPDVFAAGRDFPVPLISFDLLNNYANEIYIKATTSGFVIDPRDAGTADPDSHPDFWGCINSGNFCDRGIHITLLPDSTFDVRGVSSVYSDCSGSESNSIYSEEASPRNYPIPANGLIFVKAPKVWVDGQIDGDRVTILAFEEPFAGGSADIIINNDLLYTNYDGADAIGLIAQEDVSVGQYSEDYLEIDAALVAKDGRVGRNHYDTWCTNWRRQEITVYGSLATKNRYGFAYTDGTGYVTRNLRYDNNLTFAPPPHFPTTGEYTFISWKEE